MSFFAILVIALGLAMDAFAVSITSGIAIKNLRMRHALLIAAAFGVFQAVMPLLGWFMGSFAGGILARYNHFVAFILLVSVGIKMIFESFKLEEEKIFNPLSPSILLLLALATSIDALAVGFTLSLLTSGIFQPAIIIGIVTFLLSLIGVHIGAIGGHLFENKLEILGGIILIAIGFKILVEHLLT